MTEPTTPAHLVHSHGYDQGYATGLSPAEREAQHRRLHEDATAKHLDHSHDRWLNRYVPKDGGYVETGVAFLLVGLIVAFIVVSWFFSIKAASTSAAAHRLSEAGYSNVHVSGRHWFLAETKCNGDKYDVYMKWTGTAPNGTQAHGVICKGEWPLGGWKVQF